MLRTEDVLAIEPECYRRWRADAAAHQRELGLLERVLSPAAKTRLAPGRKSIGDIAVIRLSGFITQKPSLFSELFGGTSTEGFAAEVRAALVEPSIGAVVLDVDSPGGLVFGVPEAAAVIRGARGGKPFVAVSNPLMASAAYHLASQAEELVAAPSSLTGNIGIMSVYVDESGLLEKTGVEVEEITFGRRKSEASGLKPLTDEARTAIQDQVDYYGGLFVTDVAKGRGVSPSQVRTRFGEGAVFTVDQALASGMVDRVGTLEDVIGGLAAGRKIGVRAAAAPDTVEIRARAALAGVKGVGVE